MTRNLKALGLALMAVLALGVVVAQGASAHQFHSDAATVNGTGKILPTVPPTPHKFAVGTAGTVECTSLVSEGTDTFTLVSGSTYEADEVTVVPHYSGCTFGGNPATVNFNHCAYKFDSDTTAGNTTGGEHANVFIECKDKPIEITTSVCTLTVGEQLVKHAVRYENDTATSIILRTTAHGIVIGNLNDKGGCVLMPKGAVGRYTGDATNTCYEDKNAALGETDKTTPTGKLTHGPETECKIV